MLGVLCSNSYEYNLTHQGHWPRPDGALVLGTELKHALSSTTVPVGQRQGAYQTLELCR